MQCRVKTCVQWRLRVETLSATPLSWCQPAEYRKVSTLSRRFKNNCELWMQKHWVQLILLQLWITRQGPAVLREKSAKIRQNWPKSCDQNKTIFFKCNISRQIVEQQEKQSNQLHLMRLLNRWTKRCKSRQPTPVSAILQLTVVYLLGMISTLQAEETGLPTTATTRSSTTLKISLN